jgi:GNAT superfamily N-acetyltransferase
VFDSLATGVFDKPVDPDFAGEFLGDARHHLAAALDDDGQIVGIASAVHYVHPDKPPELWINEIAVAPAFRSRGIGKRMMETLFELGRSLGCVEAWVLAEDENNGARRFYAALGGRASPSTMFSFDL